MRISRHAVNLDGFSEYFKMQNARLDRVLQAARRDANNLYSLFQTAENIYFSGAVLAPDSPEVARALTLAAQAGAALFVFQQIDNPPRPFVLGEGSPVVYTEPAQSSCAAFPMWIQVFNLCLISRQPHLSDEVCRISNDIFRSSDIVGASDEDYGFADMLRIVWTQEHFTSDPIFVREEADCRRLAAGQTRTAGNVRRMTLPYLQALRSLDQRDQANFASALTEALKGHKKFWSSAKYRQQFNGFVSLELIAAGALAWDRGMRFEVESDYLPMSWIRGDLFQS